MSQHTTAGFAPATLDAKVKVTFDKANFRLMLEASFYASGVLQMERVFTLDIPTAATDGKTVFWGATFLSGLELEEMMFVAAHEACHQLFGHHARVYFHVDIEAIKQVLADIAAKQKPQTKRQHKLWNVATDIAINEMLIADKIGKAPKGVLTAASVGAELGMSHADIVWMQTADAEAIYDKLLQVAGQDGQPEPTEQGWGEHIPGSNEQGEALTPAEVDQQVNEADQNLGTAATQAALAGKCPARIEGLVKAKRESRVDWRSLLRNFVQGSNPHDWSYTKLSRRNPDVYLPGITKDGIGALTVLIDASGSTHGLQEAFLAELQAIGSDLMPEAIHIVPFDFDVREHQLASYAAGDVIEAVPAAGGGTSFIRAFEWLERSDYPMHKVIVFTDMEDTFPKDPGIDTLWVSCRHANVKAPWGQTVYCDGK